MEGFGSAFGAAHHDEVARIHGGEPRWRLRRGWLQSLGVKFGLAIRQGIAE
jgi:hypothetical protein